MLLPSTSALTAAPSSLHARTLNLLHLRCGLQWATHGQFETWACTVQITQFLPTHCERCGGTIDGAVRWLRAGGNIDMTAGDQVQDHLSGDCCEGGCLRSLLGKSCRLLRGRLIA